MPYLSPETVPAVVDDDPLEDLVHGLLAGITGVPAALVRPRWQPSPPVIPDFATNWIAFGITSAEVDSYAWIGHTPEARAGLGADQLERDETLKVLISFYGPLCKSILARFRDGVQIEFNRYDLEAAGIKFIDIGETINLPALLKEQWVKRLDAPITLRRRVRRVYAVPNLVGAGASAVDLDNEFYHTIVPIT